MEFKVDARGLACPLPVVKTKDVLAGAAAGDVVETTVDNEIAVQNLKKFATQKQYAVTAEKTGEAEFVVKIEKANETEAPKTEGSEELCHPDDRQKGMVVVISGNTMGSGEEKLGTALMKAFIFALTKQDVLPESVLLYNKGSYLSCEGSESLEDLKYLEAQGVEILTCGTCLNFYELTEKLGVGAVTNMYDIVDHMEKAGKIIRP